MKSSKKNEPLRVLQINSSSTFGGVSQIIYSFYDNINKEKVQFDFLSINESTYDVFKNEIESSGGKIYQLKIKSKKIRRKFEIYINLKKFLKNHRYEVIHISSGSFFFNLEIAIIATKCHIKRIIVHSHNSLLNENIFKEKIINLLKPLLAKFSTDFFACSMQAANSMFDKKTIASSNFKIIYNGININNFKFDSDKRNKIRKELNVNDDEILLGNVGRFVYQKNHEFIINLFDQICNKKNNYKLLLIGTGSEKDKIVKKIENYELKDKVIFIDYTKLVNDYMSAMDIFLFPSRFEGLGIVAIESQANGLKTLVSDCLPNELYVSDIIKFLPIDNYNSWENEIFDLTNFDRREYNKLIKKTNYDIKNVSNEIEKIYLEKR